MTLATAPARVGRRHALSSAAAGRRRPPAPAVDPVTRYAQAVVDGQVVAGRLARLACRRHLDDLAHQGARGLEWDAKEAERAIAFFGLLHHYKGRDDLIVLAPWQEFVIGSAFGWRRAATGLRRFRYIYLECASKQGKSTIAGGAGLLLAFFDGEPGAEVYTAATKRDQAKIPWQAAVQMVRKSPDLRKRIEILAGRLVQESSASFFAPLGRDSDSDQGINPNGAIIDELHVHADRDLLDNIEKAASVRRQPMIWKITTAGVKRESVWADERADAVAILEGRVVDDSTFAIVYTLDEDDDPFDEAVWPKANPNLGVSVQVDFLRERAAKAKRSPGAMGAYMRYHMNVPTQASEKAIDLDEWDANAGEPQLRPGQKLWGGLDLASVRDLSAFVGIARAPDGMYDIMCRFWCPEENIDERSQRDGVPYRTWVDAGLLTPTPGPVTDHAFIRRELNQLAEEYELVDLGYDGWNMGGLEAELMQDGLVILKIAQTWSGLAPGWHELERLILDHKLRHGGHPILRWMAGNVETEVNADGHQRPSKSRSSEKIDGMVALDMALTRLMTALEPEPSVYEREDRGLLEL